MATKDVTPRGLFHALAAGLMLLATASFALAQTAAILPSAKTQFIDANGAPLVGGQVYTYVPNTTSAKVTWSDAFQANPNENPITLDSAGSAFIFGQGNYTEALYDSNGNLKWTGFTQAPGTGTPSGGSAQDTAPVGAVMAYSGFVIPTNWLLAYGQALSRSTYSQLLTAITVTATNGTCASGSPNVGGFSSTTQIAVGSPVEASCLPSNSTVLSIVNGSTIQASQNATATTTASVVVFPWGNGNGVSTFNVPDLRGRAFAGADAMGGSAASRLTSHYYGASPSAPGTAGGAQHEQPTIAQANLPNVNFTNSGITLNDPGHTHAPLAPATKFSADSGSGTSGGTTAGAYVNTTAVATTGITISSQGHAASGGSGTALDITTIQPTLTVNYIIKALPQTSGAGGVVSLGGLAGDIVCGKGLICAAISAVNTIKVAGTGNGTTVATSSGTLTNGDCVSLDASGNYVDAGGPCTTGGGGGTVTAGTAGQIAFYPASAATVSESGDLSLDGSDNFLQAFGYGTLGAFNAGGTFPPLGDGTGVAIGWNFSGGNAEGDFFNTNVGADTAFRWLQMTGASSANILMNLRNVNGAASLELGSTGEGQASRLSVFDTGTGVSCGAGCPYLAKFHRDDSDGPTSGNNTVVIEDVYGASATGSRSSLFVELDVNTAKGSPCCYTGVGTLVWAKYNGVAYPSSGTNTVFGSNPVARVDANLPNMEAVGEEVNTDARGNVGAKIGLNVIDQFTSVGQGTGEDAGIKIGKQGGGRGYDYGILFGTKGGTAASELNLALLYSSGGTIPYGFDFSGVTFSSAAWKGNFSTDGSISVSPATGPIASLNVTPPSGTMSLGFNINGTDGGSTGGFSSLSPLSGLNSIIMTDVSTVNTISSFASQLTISGTGWNPGSSLVQKTGVSVGALVLGTPTGSGLDEIVGLATIARNAVSCPHCDNFGANITAQADAAAHTLIGTEIDINNNSTVVTNIGIQTGLTGSAGTGGSDISYAVGSAATPGWDIGYGFYANSMKSTGIMFGSVNNFSVAYGVKLDAVTITTAAFKSTGFAVDGSGNVVANAYSQGSNVGVDCPAGVTAGTVVVNKGIVTHC